MFCGWVYNYQHNYFDPWPVQYCRTSEMPDLLHLLRTEYLHNDTSSICADAKFMTIYCCPWGKQPSGWSILTSITKRNKNYSTKLEKKLVPEIGKKFSFFFFTTVFVTFLHCQSHSVHTFPPHFFKVPFHIILYISQNIQSSISPSGFSTTNLMQFSDVVACCTDACRQRYKPTLKQSRGDCI